MRQSPLDRDRRANLHPVPRHGHPRATWRVKGPFLGLCTSKESLSPLAQFRSGSGDCYPPQATPGPQRPPRCPSRLIRPSGTSARAVACGLHPVSRPPEAAAKPCRAGAPRKKLPTGAPLGHPLGQFIPKLTRLGPKQGGAWWLETGQSVLQHIANGRGAARLGPAGRATASPPAEPRPAPPPFVSPVLPGRRGRPTPVFRQPSGSLEPAHRPTRGSPARDWAS